MINRYYIKGASSSSPLTRGPGGCGDPTYIQPCSDDCNTANVGCQDNNNANKTYNLNCDAPMPNSNCVQNRDGDFCKPPPFLLQSASSRRNLIACRCLPRSPETAGAPNWVWIFIVGVGGLILLIIAGAIVLYCLDQDTFMTVINPCKWCECCPGYYDI